MLRLADISHIRSKNAGPFWITVDIFFDSDESFSTYAASPALQIAAIADRFGAPFEQVKRFEVADLRVIKFAYPRPVSQGGAIERDMHGGQQYVRILDILL